MLRGYQNRVLPAVLSAFHIRAFESCWFPELNSDIANFRSGGLCLGSEMAIQYGINNLDTAI